MAALIEDHHPVRIAIQTDAHIRPMRHHGLGRGFGMGGTAAIIDIRAIRGDAHGDHLGPQFPQHIGRRLIGGAIGAIDHHLQPVQPQPGRKGGLDEFLIPPAPILDPLGPPYVFGLGRRDVAIKQRLDLGLGLIAQLKAVGAKELDAIVLMRVVAGADHHAQIGAHAASQEPPPPESAPGQAAAHSSPCWSTRPSARFPAYSPTDACPCRSPPDAPHCHRGGNSAPPPRQGAAPSRRSSDRYWPVPRTPSVPNSLRVIHPPHLPPATAAAPAASRPHHALVSSARLAPHRPAPPPPIPARACRPAVRGRCCR